MYTANKHKVKKNLVWVAFYLLSLLCLCWNYTPESWKIQNDFPIKLERQDSRLDLAVL